MTYSNNEVAADYLARLLRERGELPDWYHPGKVVEEAGEAWREYIRLAGLHRRVGTMSAYMEELADTVISAYAAARAEGQDLDAAIQRKHTTLMTRAMKEGLQAEMADLRDGGWNSDVINPGTDEFPEDEGPEGKWTSRPTANKTQDELAYEALVDEEAQASLLADDRDQANMNMMAPIQHEWTLSRDFLEAVFAGQSIPGDAVSQLVQGFLPCLKIIIERGYATDGRTWEAGGWRGLLHEMIKKMDRVQFLDWQHAIGASHEMPDIINYGAMYMRSRNNLLPWGTLFGEPGNWCGPETPEIVTLCGSTRFAELFHRENLRQTILGKIVLSIGFDQRSDADIESAVDIGVDFDSVKPELDLLHKRKIDLSSSIIVISDGSGYISESTRSEIDYAIEHEKDVIYLNPAARRRYETPFTKWLEDRKNQES